MKLAVEQPGSLWYTIHQLDFPPIFWKGRNQTEKSTGSKERSPPCPQKTKRPNYLNALPFPRPLWPWPSPPSSAPWRWCSTTWRIPSLWGCWTTPSKTRPSPSPDPYCWPLTRWTTCSAWAPPPWWVGPWERKTTIPYTEAPPLGFTAPS